jgi:hypothetical protein
VTPAFAIAPWRIEGLRIVLEREPDWVAAWDGGPLPVDCVRSCGQTGVPPPPDGAGAFVQIGTRTLWVTPEPDAEERGAGADDPPLEPLPTGEPASFGGRVGTFGDRPIAGADVALLDDKDEPRATSRTGVDGAFRFDDWPFAPLEPVALRIRAEGYRERRVAGIVPGPGINVDLEPVVRTISGTARTPEVSARVIVWAHPATVTTPTDDPLTAPYAAVTDDEDRFELRGLPASERVVLRAMSVVPVCVDARVHVTLDPPSARLATVRDDRPKSDRA